MFMLQTKAGRRLHLMVFVYDTTIAGKSKKDRKDVVERSSKVFKSCTICVMKFLFLCLQKIIDVWPGVKCSSQSRLPSTHSPEISTTMEMYCAENSFFIDFPNNEQ